MSEVIKRKSTRPWLRLGALSLLMALLISISAQVSFAGNVTIHDDANILNSSARNSLTNQASSFPFNVAILTNSSYTSITTFDNQVNNFMSSFNGLVVAVSPSLHHSYVTASSNLGLSSSQDSALSSAGNSFFQQSNWQGGISAILNQARSYGNVSSGSTSNSGSFPSTSTSSSSSRSSGFPIWGCLIIAVIAFVAFSVFGAGRRNNVNNGGGGYRNNFGPGYGNGYGPGYNGGYNNGYNNNNNGIGPLGGGVIGAGLGGIAGYEIGKNVGENEHNNNSGFFGGNSGSTWGNDNGGGFTAGGSSGGSSSGGGSDWGSSGGSFGSGGGGDWGGGGGGGGDSGGGSSW